MAKDAKRKNVFGLDATSIIPKEEIKENKEVVEAPVSAEKAPQDAPAEKVEETPVEEVSPLKTSKKVKKEAAPKKVETKSAFLKELEAKAEKKEIRNGRFQCKIKESYLKHFDDVVKRTGMSRADILEKLIDENLR